MEVVIIKYNAGNIQSVKYALERIGVSFLVTDDVEEIKKADRIIFPGVGEASSAMKYLKEKKIDQLIPLLAQPVLGICLGMQLMCKYSEENDTGCIGIFETIVKRFDPSMSKERLKVPQIGWNTIYDLRSSLFNNIPGQSFCYFVHGYYAETNKNTIAKTNYCKEYSSALQKNNFYGVQFHPEKSAAVGEQILKNFLSI